MLWTLLTLTSTVTFIGTAVETAKRANSGFAGFALAMTVGILLAVCNAWVTYQIGEGAQRRLSSGSVRGSKWGLRVLYTAAALWIPCATFLGDWAATLAIRVVH